MKGRDTLDYYGVPLPLLMFFTNKKFSIKLKK
jgi:hypothetical protein